jgi:hypothetical protein
MERRQLYLGLLVVMAVALASIMSAGDVPDRPPEQPKAEVFSGTIREVNTEKRVITLETTPLTKTFGVPPDCEVMTEDKPRASLEDLTVGSVATITYEDTSGVLVAHRIEQKQPPPEAGKTGGVFTVVRGARL